MSQVYDHTIVGFVRSLQCLLKFMDKAREHAAAKKFDVDTLLSFRLAPDMLPFSRQVQISCDTAKAAAARLAGQVPPKHEDHEKTMDELQQRVKKVLAYLETFKASDFDGYESRRVVMPWAPEKWMHAGDYLPQMAIPNFYFHVTMSYAILRHNGVDLGKSDFLGHVDIQQG